MRCLRSVSRDCLSWAMLFLDATGRAEVLRQWAPALEVVDIEVQAPHQHVVQVADRAFSRTMLTSGKNAEHVAKVLMVELAKAKGPVLAVCQMTVEPLLRDQVVARGGVPVPAEGQREAEATTFRF